MRGWHVVATGAGLIVLTVLAPVVGGTVWATVAAPDVPRGLIAPALVVPFRADSEPALMAAGTTLPQAAGTTIRPTGAPSATTTIAADPADAATDTGRTALSDAVRATASETYEEGSEEYAAGPQIVPPDRVREVPEAEKTEAKPSGTPATARTPESGGDEHRESSSTSGVEKHEPVEDDD